MPFDASAEYFAQRVEFDRERMADLLAEVRTHATGRRVLDLASTPYILDAALLRDGFEVSLNALPFGDARSGTAILTVDGSAHECPLDLFDVETDRFPYDDGSFDAIVAGEIFEHLYLQPWHLLREAWRCLDEDGLLVLSTPNAESLERLYLWLKRRTVELGFNPDAPTIRHAREYGPAEIGMVLETQGFEVLDVYTPSYVHIRGGFPGPLGHLKRRTHRVLKAAAARRTGPLARRGDAIIAVARKSPQRPPGAPPAFMLYSLGDPRNGHNFPPGTSVTLD
jgi:SAM-dependent methyltransferase